MHPKAEIFVRCFCILQYGISMECRNNMRNLWLLVASCMFVLLHLGAFLLMSRSRPFIMGESDTFQPAVPILARRRADPVGWLKHRACVQLLFSTCAVGTNVTIWLELSHWSCAVELPSDQTHKCTFPCLFHIWRYCRSFKCEMNMEMCRSQQILSSSPVHFWVYTTFCTTYT